MKKTNRTKVTFSSIVIMMMIGVFCLSGCAKKEMEIVQPLAKNPEVTIEMENGEKIVVELYYDQAPNTVRNFISLINEGYYDGVIFHRVIAEFMIQGGDPEGTGMGAGPGYTIAGEFADNGYTQNKIVHEPGVISMARRSGDNNSASSQFFICTGDAKSLNIANLNGKYAAFGKVISGMDEVYRISRVQVSPYDKPLKDEVIKTMTVDTFDTKFDKPKTIK